MTPLLSERSLKCAFLKLDAMIVRRASSIATISPHPMHLPSENHPGLYRHTSHFVGFCLVNQMRYHSRLLGHWLQAHEELNCRYCIYTKILFFLYVPARSLRFHINHLLVSASAMSRACAGLPISNTFALEYKTNSPAC
jgi:hypothetical protein